MVADCDLDLGDLGHHAELSRAQQRHRRHSHAARLEDAKPACYQPGIVRPPEQDPIARHQAQVFDEDARDLIRSCQEVRICPRAGVGNNAAARACTCVDVAVKQLRGAVHGRWVLQLGQREQQLRPAGSGREVVARERIDMRRLRDLHQMPSRCTALRSTY